MLTTKDIIKILPFDEEYKNQLFLEFDELDENRKSALTDILWEGYSAYYKLKLEANIKSNLSILPEGTKREKLDENFYKKMVQKTEEELESSLTQESSATDLAEARKAMELIVKEIQAANKSK